MHRIYPVIATIIGLQFSSVAVATSEPLQLTMTSEAVYLALGQAHRNSPNGLKTHRAVEMIALAVLDDNLIDATERQLLDALVQAQPAIIAVAPPSTMSERVTIRFVNKIPSELQGQLAQLQPTSGEWAGFAQQLGVYYKALDASQQVAVDAMLQSALAIMNTQLPATTFGPLEWQLLRQLMVQGNHS